jgi:anti-sigma factor RsiW
MIEMTCSEVEAAATEYALDLLPPVEASAVSAHILQCPDCRNEIGELQELGDRLLDLVPDAEPPLGFDKNVLARVAPGPASRHNRFRNIGAVAAALIAAAVSMAALLSGGHHSTAPELTGAFRQGGRQVGSVYVSGRPAWVSMTITQADTSGPVTCQLLVRDGTVLTLGKFSLVDGHGSWSAPDPEAVTELTGARLIGPSGQVIATASFAGD